MIPQDNRLEIAPVEAIQTIMVVEDEVLTRMCVAEYLRGCGLHVVEAASGEEAVKVLTEGETAIDLVFSDVQLPGDIDGFALASWVRAHRPEMPVILTSGNSKVADKARQICAEGPLVEKPYEHEALLQQLRRTLARRTSEGTFPRSA